MDAGYSGVVCMDGGYAGKLNVDSGMSGPKAASSGFKALAIVRDQYGRIVVDESVFHDPRRLEQLRNEVMKNGGNASNSNP